jgi:hypothetical protein
VEKLTPEDVELQLLVWHHPQVALTQHGRNHCFGDDIGGEVLKIDPIVMEERPHEAA